MALPCGSVHRAFRPFMCVPCKHLARLCCPCMLCGVTNVQCGAGHGSTQAVQALRAWEGQQKVLHKKLCRANKAWCSRAACFASWAEYCGPMLPAQSVLV